MGCYDSICSFSKIPISWSDNVVAQYVFTGCEHNSIAESRWGQIGLPLFGMYNDYGGIEKNDTSHINYKILERTCNYMGENQIRLMDRSYYDSVEPTLIERFICNTKCKQQMLDTYFLRGTYKKSEQNENKFEIDESTGNFSRICLIHRDVYDHVVSVGRLSTDIKITPHDIDNYLELRRKWARDNTFVRIHDSTIMQRGFNINSYNNAIEYEYDSVVFNVHNLLLREPNDCYPSMSMDTYKAINSELNDQLADLSYEHPLIISLIENSYFRIGRLSLNLELVPHFSYAYEQHRDSASLNQIRDFHKMAAKLSTKLKKTS